MIEILRENLRDLEEKSKDKHQQHEQTSKGGKIWGQLIEQILWEFPLSKTRIWICGLKGFDQQDLYVYK